MFKIIRNTALAAVAVTAALVTQSAPANAGSNPYIGEMMLVGFNFCPRGWITAEGQLLPIAQNSALNGTGAAADVGVVAGNSFARSGSTFVYNAAAPTLPMADGSVTTTVTVASSGSGQAFSIRNPYLGMQWCVVTEGTFPPRN